MLYRTAILFISLLAFLVIAFVVLLYCFQEKLIFFPEKIKQSESLPLFQNSQERYFKTTDVEIHAIHYKNPNAKGVILYFHGNAGSLRSWGSVVIDFQKYPYDVVVVDYRGYGKSGGEIQNEAQLHQDAEIIYNELAQEYANIILYGRSIGTGIASELAAKKNGSLLILETPYYSLPDLASQIYPFLPSFLVKYKLDNAKNIQKVQHDVHLIHGTNDSLIPHSSSERLQQLGNHIHLHSVANGEHNNLSAFAEFHFALQNILANHKE